VGSVAVIPAPALAAGYDPATDPYSMANIATATGATAWWNAGYTGAGVDVAVIDTGVSRVPGLDATGKVFYGPDLSLESQAPNLRHLDTNGHGTFMAGLIAANSAAYKGIAPGARILSVKVGVADGGVDVSQVIAAIDWIVQHKTDNGLNIRVINLSYGTNSLQSYKVDPLAHAVEQAWKRGIVVVAAAGNSGYQRGEGAPGLANPAYNPYIIGVGGYDTNGTAIPNDDTMGTYSASSAGCGSTCKNPDFVAPGSHIQGLRVPNSFVDLNHPEGRLGTLYFRGSGTSQAAAIASGAVALILQKYPTLTPDRVKKLIGDSAKKVPGADTQAQGKGEINLVSALATTPLSYTQSFTASTGKGTLDGARGSDRLTDDGVVLSGEKDIFGKAWNAAAMATATAAGNTWSGGTWNGNTWSGNTWSGNTWSGNTWSGNSWSGNTWSGNTWSTGGWN
jgi:serine protease AprX